MTDILLYGGLFLGGVIAGLKVVAPLTKTKADDKVLDVALIVKRVLETLGINVPEATVEAAAREVARKA